MRQDDFMNAEDVARYLHLGKNTVYQLAKSGAIASYHVGRKLRFTLEDVESYVASTHSASSSSMDVRPAVPGEGGLAGGLSEAASFGKLKGSPLVIAGGDAMADVVASALNASGMPTARLVRGSYTALVNLYANDAQAAVIHLYDQRTNSYNIPYVRSLAPGVSVFVYRICGREAGFIVQKGNPKGLTTWGGLLREGVRLANRVKGSGARVLLDEKLSAMEARSESIGGYNSESTVAREAVRRVSAGLADVAIGTARDARYAESVAFVPLQMEWVDLVVRKTPGSRSAIRHVSALLDDERFRSDVKALGPSDLSKMGAVVYES